MKIHTGAEQLDLEGKSFVLVVKEGNEAEIRFSGSNKEVGQLLDAAFRGATGYETDSTKSIH